MDGSHLQPLVGLREGQPRLQALLRLESQNDVPMLCALLRGDYGNCKRTCRLTLRTNRRIGAGWDGSC